MNGELCGACLFANSILTGFLLTPHLFSEDSVLNQFTVISRR